MAIRRRLRSGVGGGPGTSEKASETTEKFTDELFAAGVVFPRILPLTVHQQLGDESMTRPVTNEILHDFLPEADFVSNQAQ